MTYEIIKVVKAEQVPDWERRPPKWSELVEAVLELQPNQSLQVRFADPQVATRARNAVRDMANLKAKQVVVRTRVVNNEDGSSLLYLTRVHPSDAHAK